MSINLTLKQNINQTLKTYSSLNLRTKLDEKLLQRPPLRFIRNLARDLAAISPELQEVLGASIKDENQEDVTKSWDRVSKMNFVQQLINFVNQNHTMGQQLSCNASKVVAGLEVSKTNNLLRMLAECVLQNGSGKSGSDLNKTLVKKNSFHVTLNQKKGSNTTEINDFKSSELPKSQKHDSYNEDPHDTTKFGEEKLSKENEKLPTYDGFKTDESEDMLEYIIELLDKLPSHFNELLSQSSRASENLVSKRTDASRHIYELESSDTFTTKNTST